MFYTSTVLVVHPPSDYAVRHVLVKDDEVVWKKVRVFGSCLSDPVDCHVFILLNLLPIQLCCSFLLLPEDQGTESEFVTHKLVRTRELHSYLFVIFYTEHLKRKISHSDSIFFIYSTN